MSLSMMKTAYKKLYDKIPIDKDGSGNPVSVFDQTFVTFTAMQGRHYASCKSIDGKELRFMLVGRAVNGWNEYRGASAFDESLFVETSIQNLTNHPNAVAHGEDRFEWIDTSQNTAKNIYRTGIDHAPEDVGKYYLTRSPFWAYTKEIWDDLYGESSAWSSRWFENIAWSNLYKVAPHHGGNPDAALMKQQEAACVELLRAEIEYFAPTHILFITGTDWFVPFKDIFSNLRFRDCNCASGKNRIFAEGTAEYRLAGGDICRVVVACRPELRNKEGYTQQVSEYLKGTAVIEDKELKAI